MLTSCETVSNLTDKVISIIKDKIQSGEIEYSRIEESFYRIKKLKQSF